MDVETDFPSRFQSVMISTKQKFNKTNKKGRSEHAVDIIRFGDRIQADFGVTNKRHI